MSKQPYPPKWDRLMTLDQRFHHVLTSLRRLEHLCDMKGVELTDSEWEHVYQMSICPKCEVETYHRETSKACDC